MLDKQCLNHNIEGIYLRLFLEKRKQYEIVYFGKVVFFKLMQYFLVLI